MKTITCFFVSICTLTVMLFTGCGNNLKTVADLNNTNIMRLHSAYNIFMSQHQMKGPKDEEELKAFLTTNNTAKALLKRMNIMPEDIPGIFTSERDGEPFKVRWGLTGVADHAIVFETTGVDGKRMVALSKPQELDDEEYEGYLSGKIKPQAPGGASVVDVAEGDGSSDEE